MDFNYINNDLKLDNSVYYYYCCAGLGDTMITLSIRKNLEKKLGKKIVFVLKKTHAIVAKMYDDKNYIIIKDKEMQEAIEKKIFKDVVPGKIYAAHPCMHSELWNYFQPIYDQVSTQRFLPWLYGFFNIDDIDTFNEPKYYPSINIGLKEKYDKFDSIDNIVMISPEATSMLPMPDYFWEELVDDLNNKGYTVVSNVIKKENTVKGSKYINLTAEEAVILGLNCKAVYSVRSGLCDLLFDKGKNLHVYYPTYSSYFIYSLNYMFKRTDIDEVVLLKDME